MGFLSMLVNSLWAGLFAGCMGILLTAPLRFVAPAFVCGFTGRLARDLLMGWGSSPNWATALAAAVVVLVAKAALRRHSVSPVVLVSGVLPLGAAVAMFNAIVGLMRVSTATPEALREASASLSGDVGKVFTTSLAIALGLSFGLAIARLPVWQSRRRGDRGDGAPAGTAEVEGDP